MANKQFLFVLDGSVYKPMYEHMLMDVALQENVTFVIDSDKNNRWKQFMLRNKVQKFTNGKLDFLGYEENNLYITLKYICQKYESVVVIFLNAALNHNSYLAETLQRYKEKWKNLKYVLFYLDIMGAGVSRNADYLQKKGVFDLIYTTDSGDALRHNLLKWKIFYSLNTDFMRVVPYKELYFCGVSKNREKILQKCAEASIKKGCSCTLDIVSYEDATSLEKFENVIHALNDNEYLSYPEVLRRELGATCLLDVVQPGQIALTLRPYEAVVYNRKLLTNNKTILDFEFYDPRFMQYFESVDQIDWEWVKQDIKVDYSYKGEFSPKLFLEDIEKRLE